MKTEPFRPGFTGGWLFHGTEGSIAGTSLFDPEGKLVSTFSPTRKSENHFANFLNAVRSRKREELNADIEEGHLSTSLCHAGNISWRLGRPVTVEAVLGRIGELQAHDDVQETLGRTVTHLRDNQVDLAATPLVLGSVLLADPSREAFLENEAANAFLTREYRVPFVVPAESEF